MLRYVEIIFLKDVNYKYGAFIYTIYFLCVKFFFIFEKKKYLLLLTSLNKIVKYTDSCHIQQSFDPHITIQYSN